MLVAKETLENGSYFSYSIEGLMGPHLKSNGVQEVSDYLSEKKSENWFATIFLRIVVFLTVSGGKFEFYSVLVNLIF